MQTEYLLIGALLLAVLILQLVALLRRPPHDRLEQAVREEARSGRSELREQLDGFARALTDLSTRTDQRLDLLREALGEDARKARAEAAERQQRGAALMGQRLQELRAQLEVSASSRRPASMPLASSCRNSPGAPIPSSARCARPWWTMRARGARKVRSRSSA